MSSWISLLAASADVLILLTLVTVVASPRVSQSARPVIATFAFVWAWALAAALDVLRAPGWAMVIGGAVIVATIAVITVTVHLWALEGDDGKSSPGQPGDEGGGGPRRRRPSAPQRGGGGSDPAGGPSSSASSPSTLPSVNGQACADQQDIVIGVYGGTTRAEGERKATVP